MTASEMGKKGIRIRLAKMTASERREQASRAGKARWKQATAEERKAYMRKIRKARRRKKSKKHPGENK